MNISIQGVQKFSCTAHAKGTAKSSKNYSCQKQYKEDVNKMISKQQYLHVQKFDVIKNMLQFISICCPSKLSGNTVQHTFLHFLLIYNTVI